MLKLIFLSHLSFSFVEYFCKFFKNLLFLSIQGIKKVIGCNLLPKKKKKFIRRVLSHTYKFPCPINKPSKKIIEKVPRS